MRLFLLLVYLVCFASSDIRAQSDPATQRRFSLEMASTLLGSSTLFADIGNGLGQRGFLLPQIGSTIAPLAEAYSGVQGQLSQSLADMVVFDKPVTASSGIAIPGSSRLPDVWRDILDRSRPGFSLIRDRALDAQTMHWLFKKNNTSKPNQLYSREPSTYYNRYKEFASRYATLYQDSLIRTDVPSRVVRAT